MTEEEIKNTESLGDSQYSASNPNGSPRSASTKAKGTNSAKTKAKSTKSTSKKKTTKKKKPPKKSTSSTNGSMTKATKAAAKDDVLNFIKNDGMTWNSAAEAVRDRYGYSRTTPYKWLKDVEGKDSDGNNIIFRDLVIAAERLVLGQYETALLKAARGGEVTGHSKKSDVLIEYYANGAVKKKKIINQESITKSAPSAVAAEKGLMRGYSRLSRVDQNKDNIERTPDPIVMPLDDEGNPVDFSKYQILTMTFGVPGKDSDDSE